MASGTARRHQGPESAGRLLALSLLAASLAGPAYGQAESQLASPPVPAPFSRDCQIGSTAIVEESSLPHVAAALQSRKQIKILAIGASPVLTRRTYGSHGDTVSRLLKQAVKGLDVVMINRGVSGELAEQAAQRIKNEVALTEPDLLLWQVGTNDALAYVPLDDFEQTVMETLTWLKEHKVDVVLVGLQYVSGMARDSHYQALRVALRRIAQQENVIIVRRYEAMEMLEKAQRAEPGTSVDEFANSETAYNCMAQYVARAISVALFGRGLRPEPQAPRHTPSPP